MISSEKSISMRIYYAILNCRVEKRVESRRLCEGPNRKSVDKVLWIPTQISSLITRILYILSRHSSVESVSETLRAIVTVRLSEKNPLLSELDNQEAIKTAISSIRYLITSRTQSRR